MLRFVVLGLGFACIAGGITVAVAEPHLWVIALQFGGFGVLVLGSILFEKNYRGRRQRVSVHLQQTGEKFVDPTTGKLTEVLYDPKTGERIYRQV